MRKKIYVLGSLRNPNVPQVAEALRKLGFNVFDDWYAAGPEADDYWQKYEESRGTPYNKALHGLAANHVFHFDAHHLDSSDIGVLVLPAGKSAHLELGWLIGQGKPGYILFPDGEWPERWDVMYRFATGVFNNFDALREALPALLPAPSPESFARVKAINSLIGQVDLAILRKIELP